MCSDKVRQFQLLVKECALNTGQLLTLSLKRKSVVGITNHPEMISDVYRGHETTNQSINLISGATLHIC